MHSLRAIGAGRIFTGENWLDNHAVLIRGEVVEDLLPAAALPEGIPVEQYPDAWLVPAFIDLQIYGAYGKLLAVYPEADSLYKLNAYCRSGGAALCMPTVATNTADVFFRSIDAIRDYWQRGGEGVMGLHVEGPWLHPLRRGAHIESLIHPPTEKEVRKLLDYGRDVIRIITLAPEMVSPAIIELILSRGILISAGHSNASYAEALAGFDRGIRAVTHLYNAMSPLQHRAPGLVGAAFLDQRVMASIIPDGYHVDYAAIRIAKQMMRDRLFVITDAVTETTEGAYPHQSAGDKYEASGILSGSALTMLKAAKNLVQYADVEAGEAFRMCSLYPARLLRLDKEFGKIEKGCKNNLLLLNQQLELIKWV